MKFYLPLCFLLVSFSISAHINRDILVIGHAPQSEISLKSTNAIPQGFFIKLKKKYCPVRYMQEAVLHIGGIVFKKMPDNVDAYYNRLNRKIYFSLKMQNPVTRQLKALEDLTLGQLDIFFHELWHAYFYTVAKPRNLLVYQNWKDGARSLYPDHGEQIHDESYAFFIEKILRNYLMIRKYFDNKPDPQGREHLRNSQRMQNIYQSYFTQRVTGYYVKWPRRFVYSDVNLPREDRINILQNVFDGIIKENYLEAYSEDRF